jgi:hypothetical protein
VAVAELPGELLYSSASVGSWRTLEGLAYRQGRDSTARSERAWCLPGGGPLSAVCPVHHVPNDVGNSLISLAVLRSCFSSPVLHR